jgi:hypothetical protein
MAHQDLLLEFLHGQEVEVSIILCTMEYFTFLNGCFDYLMNQLEQKLHL